MLRKQTVILSQFPRPVSLQYLSKGKDQDLWGLQKADPLQANHFQLEFHNWLVLLAKKASEVRHLYRQC